MGESARGVERKAAAARRADSEQLVRQWAILRLLSNTPRGYSVKELAEQLRATKSTVQRDLATLGRDFALLDERVGAQKRVYRIDAQIRALETLTFGAAELLALYAALAQLQATGGTPMHDDLREVTLKLRGFLAPKHNGFLAALAGVFAPHARDHVDHTPHREHLDDLVDAIAKRRVCELRYHAAWKGTTRDHLLRPLKLVWHRGNTYVFGCLGRRSEVTTLAVSRIKSLKPTTAVFAAPRTDVEAHVKKAFGIFIGDVEEDVEVLFEADTAWRIEERTHHPDEQKQRLPDGRLRYRLRSGAQWEIIPWVLGFGAHAELVTPVAWRDVVRTHLEATMQRYRTAPVAPAVDHVG